MISLTAKEQRKLIELYNKEVDENYGNTIQIMLDMNKSVDTEKLKNEADAKKAEFRKILQGDDL